MQRSRNRSDPAPRDKVAAGSKQLAAPALRSRPAAGAPPTSTAWISSESCRALPMRSSERDLAVCAHPPNVRSFIAPRPIASTKQSASARPDPVPESSQGSHEARQPSEQLLRPQKVCQAAAVVCAEASHPRRAEFADDAKHPSRHLRSAPADRETSSGQCTPSRSSRSAADGFRNPIRGHCRRCAPLSIDRSRTRRRSRQQRSPHRAPPQGSTQDDRFESQSQAKGPRAPENHAGTSCQQQRGRRDRASNRRHPSVRPRRPRSRTSRNRYL